MSRSTDPKLLALASNPEKALATSFFSALGVSLVAAVEIIDAICKEPAKYKLLFFQFLVAAVQVRQNVTFIVVPESRDFPALTIASQRAGVPDMFNFKLYHVVGQILLNVAKSNPVALKMLAKGNCITGEGSVDTKSGKINVELYNSFTASDKAYLANWMGSAQRQIAEKIATTAISAMQTFVQPSAEEQKKV